MLSHETAAELQRLTDKPAQTIHVTVPGERRVAAIPGVSHPPIGSGDGGGTAGQQPAADQYRGDGA